MSLPIYTLGMIYTGVERPQQTLWLIILVQMFLIGNNIIGLMLHIDSQVIHLRSLLFIETAAEVLSYLNSVRLLTPALDYGYA